MRCIVLLILKVLLCYMHVKAKGLSMNIISMRILWNWRNFYIRVLTKDQETLAIYLTKQGVSRLNRLLIVGGTTQTRSNNRNAKPSSKDTGKRPSATFLNCIKNLEEVQSRYGVNEKYQLAVERGDVRTARTLLDEAAKKAGYIRVFTFPYFLVRPMQLNSPLDCAA